MSVEESWRRIDAWLAQHAKPARKTLAKGARPADLERLEQDLGRALPADLRASLLVHDGQKDDWPGLACGHALYESTRIADDWRAMREVGEQLAREHGDAESAWRAEFIPIGGDGAGNLLYVDAVEGAVRDFDHEGWVHTTLAPSWAAWLETFARGLEAGQAEWDDDEGLETSGLFGDEPFEPDPAVRAAQAAMGRVDLCEQSGRIDEALAELDRALAACPRAFPEARRRRARLRIARGDRKGAAEDLALLDPQRFHDVPHELALVRLGEGDELGARQSLARCRDLATRLEVFGEVRWQGDPEVLRGLALLDAIERGTPPALDPRERELVGDWRAVARPTLAEIGDPTSSDMAVVIDLSAGQSEQDAAITALVTSYREGGPLGTLAEAEAGLEGAPDDPLARLRRGLLRAREGDVVGATMDVSRVLAASSGHPALIDLRNELQSRRR